MNLRQTMVLAALLVASVDEGAKAIDGTQFPDPDRQALYDKLIRETRCPECTNQSLAESVEVMAAGVRVEIADLVRNGMSEGAIRAILVERRGESVLYQPRLKPATIWLWILPALLMVAALWVYARAVRARVGRRRSHGMSDV